MFCATLPTDFFPQRLRRSFSVWPPKKSSSCVFLQTLAAVFVQIFRDFSRIFDKSNLSEVLLRPRPLHHCPKQGVTRQSWTRGSAPTGWITFLVNTRGSICFPLHFLFLWRSPRFAIDQSTVHCSSNAHSTGSVWIAQASRICFESKVCGCFTRIGILQNNVSNVRTSSGAVG